MSAKCHKRTLRSDSAHGLRGWDAPCPRDLDSEVSKVAVVRVGLGYMVIGHRDSATPSGGDRGSYLWEEPHRVHRRLVDRRVRGLKEERTLQHLRGNSSVQPKNFETNGLV